MVRQKDGVKKNNTLYKAQFKGLPFNTNLLILLWILSNIWMHSADGAEVTRSEPQLRSGEDTPLTRMLLLSKRHISPEARTPLSEHKVLLNPMFSLYLLFGAYYPKNFLCYFSGCFCSQDFYYPS